MGERVLLHRHEEVQRGNRGQRRVAESGVFDVDADDNPDWVKEALAERAKAEPKKNPLVSEFTETENDGGNVAAVLDTVEFGANTSVPEGVDEPVDEAEPDEPEETELSKVLNSVPFGEDPASSEGSDDEKEEAPAPKRSARGKKADESES